ncbi:MAG: hypothetical protein ACXVC7_03490 [Bacteroidia bacterium]
MKKISFIMLFTVVCLNQIIAQCQCCGSMSGFSGGESTPGAFALGKNNWLVESYADCRFFNGISNEQRVHDLGVSTTSVLTVNHMGIGIVGARYGISDRAILLVQQPMFWVSGTTVNSKTIGDLLSLVNYMALNKPGLAVDLQAGMEFPTGQAVQFSNGSSVSTGSGSFDPVAGLSIKKPFARSFIRASGFFKYTTKGFNDTYFGNFFSQQVNYTIFLSKVNASCSPDSLPVKQKPVVSLGLQLMGEWSQMQMKNNAFIENTGAYVALGALSVAVAYKGFSVPLMFSVPFYQQYHGEQNMTKFRIRVGITKTFK